MATWSERPVDTAPLVRHHNGASIPRSPSAWTSATVRPRPFAMAGKAVLGRSSAASTDTTPANPSADSASRRAATTCRSRQSSSRTRRRTSAPCPVSAAVTSASSIPSAVTSSQVPWRAAGAAALTGDQVTR